MITSLTGFPSLENPDILALAPHPQPPIIALAYKIDDSVKAYGISNDKQPYRPHLTIARMDKNIKMDLSKINIPKLRLTIDEIRLYQSEPSSSSNTPSVYKTLATFPLVE